MQTECTLINSVVVLKPQGKYLDAFTSKGFREEAVKQHGAGQRLFIVDLSNVEFIDSAGIGVIIHLHKMTAKEGKLSLCGLCPRITNVLMLVNLQALIPIFPNLETALKRAQ